MGDRKPKRCVTTPATLPEGWGKAIEGFVVSLEKQGYSPYTIRDYRVDVARLAHRFPGVKAHVELHHVLTAAEDLKREGVPLSYQRRRLAAWHRFRSWLTGPLEESLATTVLKACAMESLSDQVLVAAISYAGLRPCELVQLEGRDVRMKQDHIICRSGMRVIPLHPTLKDVLLRFRREFPRPPYRPLLPGPNGFPVNTRTLHARFRRLMTRIGMPEVCPESLRRDTAARLRVMGAPPGLVRAFLGKDQGRACAPRRGQHNDLTSLRQRLLRVPGLPLEVSTPVEACNLLL